MISARPRRSALYLPASNARAIEKSRSLACDVVILDLEDAVAPDAKTEARDGAVAALKAGGFGAREVVIRANGFDTPWGADDLAAAAAAGPDAVLIPKVSTPADIVAARALLPAAIPLWAMIETCAAMFRLDALGAASVEAGVTAWVIGSNDLAKEMRCALDVERAPLMTALSLSLMAARAHGLAILDGVYNDIADTEGLARQCAQGLALGFDGKTLIHPSQVEASNTAFTPEAGAVTWARTVVAAFDAPEAAGRGVLKVEGRMVERLHLEQAQRLIAVADAIAARQAG
jgi:citrate lyase subunit beta/citryl-CoA lyase